MPSTSNTSAAWPTAFRALVDKRRPLLLQGPMGWFFNDLAKVLTDRGQTVTKVHFNGGDRLFWRQANALSYQGRPDDLADWLGALIRERRIDAVVLFGQMRPIHCVAREVAKALGVGVFVLEEGYLRPNYVTIERRGVNALSRLPRSASFYTQNNPDPVHPPAPTHQNIWRTALIAAAYGSAAAVMRPWYPHIDHHRNLHPVRETAAWARGAWRHLRYRITERGVQARLCSPALSKRWFLVPLQVQGDSQISHHSRYTCIEQFIIEVLESFALHAPAEIGLVFKHHPMDRAYADYTRLFHAETLRLKIRHRVMYVHDQHLPSLLDHARGVVTINSTVGLQALHHHAPVITLGESVYSIPGLVYRRSLTDFWTDPGVVDAALYKRFRNHLIAHTQLNASFYAEKPALELPPANAASNTANPSVLMPNSRLSSPP